MDFKTMWGASPLIRSIICNDLHSIRHTYILDEFIQKLTYQCHMFNIWKCIIVFNKLCLLGTINQESWKVFHLLFLHIYWLATSSVLFQVQVACHLFPWNKVMAYAYYYERALTNGVLNIQRCNEPGIMIYMLPQEDGSYKVVLFS